MRFFALLATLLAVPALAQPPEPPPLTIAPNGSYHLTYIVDDAPVYVRITHVTDMRGGPTDPDPPTDPDEPEDPDDPTLDEELRANVEAWAKDVGDPQGAQAIATTYSVVRKSLQSGSLTPEQLWQLLPILTDRALQAVGASEKWDADGGFRDKLGAEIARWRAAGKAETVAQIDHLLGTVQKGLSDSANMSYALDLDLSTGIIHAALMEILTDATN